MTTIPSSLLFLSIFSSSVLHVFTSAQPSSSPCNVGCGSDSNVLFGFPSLQDLQCAMQREYDSITSGSSVLDRDPPYLYQLCPNTTHVSTDPIVPLLNDTIVSCEMCRVRAPVRIWLDADDASPMTHVGFQGITFQGGDFAQSVVITSQHATTDGLVWFQDCHWENRTWAIEHIPDTTSSSSSSVLNDDSTTNLEISLQSCTMTNSDTTNDDETTFGIRLNAGTEAKSTSLTVSNLTVSNYNVSSLLDIRGSSTVARLANVHIVDSILKDPSNFNDFMFVGNQARVYMDQVTLADTNQFDNFCWIQGGAYVEANASTFAGRDFGGDLFRLTGSAGGLSLQQCDLIGNGFALVSASGKGPLVDIQNCTFDTKEPNTRHALFSHTNTMIRHSCFSGSTIFPPIFIHDAAIQFENVHSDVTVKESNCTDVFIEQEGDECFYPTDPKDIFSILKCDGGSRCVPLDADTCFLKPSIYPPAPISCNDLLIGAYGDCSNFTITENACIASLQELRCAMCLDAASVAITNATSVGIDTDGPFIYRLCPDTVYSITNEALETIVPILNDTRIHCGADRAAETDNNCTIVGGILQMEIGQGFRSSEHDSLVEFIAESPLTNVQVSGLTFTNGVYDPTLELSPSVWTRSSGVTVIFSNCRWTKGVGSHILLNKNMDEMARDGDDAAANVSFEGCRFQDIGGPNYGIYSQGGSVFMSNTQMNDCEFENDFYVGAGGVMSSFIELEVRNNAYNSFAHIIQGAASTSASYYMDEAVFIGNTGLYEVRLVVGNESFGALQSPTATLRNCLFDDNVGFVSMVYAENTNLTMQSILFRNSQATVGIHGKNNTTLQLQESCFVGGEYQYTVLVEDKSIPTFVNVYGNSMADCLGVAIKNDNDDDLFDGPVQCNEFDASTCPLFPSIAPTLPPSSPRPTPTMPPSVAPTPSNLVVVAVVALTFAFACLW